MSEKLTFSVNTLPEFVAEPIKYLSVVTNSQTLENVVAGLLQQSHVYKGTGINNVLEIVQSTIKSGAPYYVLEFTSDRNKLRIDSSSPKSVSLVLDDHTYNHHSYAGRYLRFTKCLPAKGSKDYIIYHKATANWGPEKYEKDLTALVAEVFTGADMTLLTTCGPPNIAPGGSLTDLHEKASPSSTALYLPEDAKVSAETTADSPSGITDTLPSDVSQELYEYLSLVHLNALPDFTNSHVRATSLYEIPDTVVKLPVSLSSASLVTITDVNPVVFYDLASNPDCLSIQATTETGSFLTVNSGDVTWNWALSR
ncbi:hypothetical protein JCM33374_g3224 [Metschnikowia sp. JCM 33374]|nr:hypothetical protein JCM33374_g3224 [Metschnikowia sp. JCM 33374]